jgi:hypothetical protein
MDSSLFYLIALPFIIGGALASIGNAVIQYRWFKHYLEHFKKDR